MDDRLARVYARSARVKKELPDYHEALRTAVGVARGVQVGGWGGLKRMVPWGAWYAYICVCVDGACMHTCMGIYSRRQ